MDLKNIESRKQEIRDFAWRILDVVLRGTFKHHETGEILLPFVVLRRLDCMLEHSAADVRNQAEQLKTQGFDEETVDRMLKSAAVEVTERAELLQSVGIRFRETGSGSTEYQVQF